MAVTLSITKGKKIALVTGGARRLGKEITLSLANCGFDVIINYFHTPEKQVKNLIEIVRKRGVKATAIRADISNVNEIKKLFVKVKRQFEKLDILVNNAAIFGQIDFFDIKESDFDKFVNTNLKSVLFCSQQAARLMKCGPGCSHIINIASLGAILNWKSAIPYSLAKAGVVKLTELLALRLAPGVLVNCIVPGTIKMKEKNKVSLNVQDLKNYPMQKFVNTHDITSLIEFLVTANNYITGQTFIVDGGRSLN
ncbi:MAG: SDR family NAD(P)-dependent oxidoreductase [Ignavibacteria bacterium]